MEQVKKESTPSKGRRSAEKVISREVKYEYVIFIVQADLQEVKRSSRWDD